jgi:hypothetical protein
MRHYQVKLLEVSRGSTQLSEDEIHTALHRYS